MIRRLGDYAIAPSIAESLNHLIANSLMDAAVDVVGATAGVHVELAPHPVDAPLEQAVLELRDRVNPPALEKQVPREHAAQMRGVRNAAAFAADCREQRD